MEKFKQNQELDELAKISNASTIKIDLFRPGARDKEKEVLFAGTCFLEFWRKLDEVDDGKGETLTKIDVVELLFYGQSFSLNSSNADLKWVKASNDESYKYKNSKPNINNKKWVVKADLMRMGLEKVKRVLASTPTETSYSFNWKDLYRVKNVMDILVPIVYKLLTSDIGNRNLVFRHGFAQCVPLGTFANIYMRCNLLIIRTFEAVQSEFKKDHLNGEFWVLKEGGKKDEVVRKGFNGTEIKSLTEIPVEGLVSYNSFLAYGMHVPATRFKEMPVFKQSTSTDEARINAEDAVCQAINTVADAVNRVLVNSNFKTDFDMNSVQENQFALRSIQRIVYCMKKSIVGLVSSATSRGHTQKYVAISNNRDKNAMKPLKF